jgi:phthalate 4,5-cis-dihydrodiol dehydrogenase
MSAERPIRLGVAGLGRAFTLMLPTFLQDKRVQLVAACDPRAEARAQFANDFSAQVHTDIEQLASDPLVEAIYIASPHQFHCEHTRIAAALKKHVLVEKPMALTLAECDAMIAACRANNVHMVVGHSHSFDSPYKIARDLAASGKYGRIRMIQALNFTDFLYRPRRPEELQTEAGGGVIFSQAAHQIDIVRMLAGSPIRQIRGITGAWDPQRPTEGAYSALLWFASGAFANITYSGYGHFDSDEWCGWVDEMGMPKTPDSYGLARQRLARLKDLDEEAGLKAARTYGGSQYQPSEDIAPSAYQHFGPIIISCEGADIRPSPGGVWVYGDGREQIRLSPPIVPRSEVIDEFYAAIIQGTPPFHDGVWARSTLQACLALLKSAHEGREISLPAAPWENTAA